MQPGFSPATSGWHELPLPWGSDDGSQTQEATPELRLIEKETAMQVLSRPFSRS